MAQVLENFTALQQQQSAVWSQYGRIKHANGKIMDFDMDNGFVTLVDQKKDLRFVLTRFHPNKHLGPVSTKKWIFGPVVARKWICDPC